VRHSFPATTFAASLPLEEQLAHVFSEVDEVAACGPEISDELLIEAMDLLHSLETFFRIVARLRGPEFVVDLQRRVYEKNRDRGYYD